MEGIGITFFVRSPNYGFVKADASPRVQAAYSEFFWRKKFQYSMLFGEGNWCTQYLSEFRIQFNIWIRS